MVNEYGDSILINTITNIINSMNNTKIKASIVADSTCNGNRITSIVAVMPRIILAELNTHRMFSRNSASSRAIPFHKNLQRVMQDPFIPIAFQQNHKGMQGKKYIDPNKKFTWSEIRGKIQPILQKSLNNEEDRDTDEYQVIDEIMDNIFLQFFQQNQTYTISEWWLKCRDLVVSAASLLRGFDTTKQICNRILEPFMWHTVLITATEWKNFFDLRAPVYKNPFGEEYVSREDYRRSNDPDMYGTSDLSWLSLNEGQSEIHMMELAECIWDAMSKSQPKQISSGQWHIPFGDKIDMQRIQKMIQGIGGTEKDYEDAANEIKIQIATARCARVSYLNFEGTDDYDKDINLYNVLRIKQHWSPFEHCALAMSVADQAIYTKSEGRSYGEQLYKGWSRNYKGFIQHRAMVDKQ